MIKKLSTITNDQLKVIMAIWLKTNIETHHYIDKEYWKSKESLACEGIKEAELYVYEMANEIKGFMGIQNNYIAGIFIEEKSQNQGIGKRFLQEIKKQNQSLTLTVYQKNQQAISFYKKQGFSVIEERLDTETNEIEYVMQWIDGELISPERKYLVTNYEKTIFLKNIITNDNIEVGDFTYYDDCHDPTEFETHVTHHYEWIGDKLIIGKFCQIASGIEFIMNGANHETRGISTYPFAHLAKASKEAFKEFSTIPKKGDTVIGHDVWFGQNVTIMPGVTIGNGAIIAANSTVASDVPDYAIYGGNPAKLIKKRFNEQEITFLNDLKWWDWSPNKIFTNYEAITKGDFTQLAKIDGWP